MKDFTFDLKAENLFDRYYIDALAPSELSSPKDSKTEKPEVIYMNVEAVRAVLTKRF